MDSSELRIDSSEKLHDDNFHILKSGMQLLHSLREVDDHLTEEVLEPSSRTYASWKRAYCKDRATIRLTVSDTHL